MSNLILPDDPNWKMPIKMGDPYSQGLTPKTASEKRNTELDAQREKDSPGTFKYANSAIAHAPDAWVKNAQAQGNTNVQTNPMWFSPLHTAQNWQIASKRREVYMWCRHFYSNEAKVAAGIDFYCFTPETEIELKDDYKPIRKIEIGDIVKCHDGSFNRVTGKFAREINESILTIHFDFYGKHTILRTTLGHKLLVHCDDHGDPIYRQAFQFAVGDCLLSPNTNGGFTKHSITKIESEPYEGIVYDFQVQDKHSYTANGIACSNSRFPMNGFELECTDTKVLNYFTNKVINRLNLNENFKAISSEYFMLGDVFIHMDIDCPKCNATGVDPETQQKCNHPGGSFSRMTVLNPDWIEVQQSVLSDDPSIVFIPDEELYRIIHYKQPKSIYDRIPDKIKEYVMQKRPIPLSNRTTSHLKHMPVPYSAYGTSLIRRLFTILAYKTKIMTANWIVAERLILPVRVVKIGSDDRPATTTDIADIQQQLASTSNDPNLTIVTHHNFCHDEQTKVLTDNGWKRFDELTRDEQVMVFDPKTEEMRYEKPLNYYEFDHDGEMIKLYGKKCDMLVTPGHSMLCYNRRKKIYKTITADEFARSTEHDRYIRAVGNYKPHHDMKSVKLCGYDIPINVFLAIAGWYLSEGHTTYNEVKYQYYVSVSQSPEANPENCDSIQKLFELLPFKFSSYAYKGRATTWNILNKDIAKQFKIWFGSNSYDKMIPSFIKNLPANKLRILIDSYTKGDASWQQYIASVGTQNGTCSKQLADDLLEIMFKSGLAPNINRYRKDSQYLVGCNMDGVGKGRFSRIKNEHITREHYKGKVWCISTSTGYFVTQRNGFIAIQGNSYEFYGASGKILQVTQEMEHIDKEILDGLMLNQSLLNGEMCLADDHEVLTSDGYKNIADVTKSDYVCVWDDYNQFYQYLQPTALFKYDNVDEIYEIKSGDKILFKCTADHKIIIQFRGVVRQTIRRPNHDVITAKELFDENMPKDQLCVLTLLKNGTYVAVTSVEKQTYGKSVYCLGTQTGYFVAKYKDTEFISGNSGYASAQVGVETLIRRIESWRESLSDWAHKNIFLPIAEMQGFIDKKKSEEMGEPIFMYPRIKWNDLNLKDQTQFHQILLQLHDKGVVSTQTLCEKLDLDYDQEVHRLRYEQTMVGPMGGGAAGGGAGGGGGAPPGGGGGGGGMPPGGDPGMMPGMDGGAGGGMGAPGGGMAAPPGAGGMPGMAQQGGSKIMKKGKTKDQQEQEPVPMQMVRLTSIEQEMYQMLEKVGSEIGWNDNEKANKIRIQFPVANPNGGKNYTFDFAMPHLKLAIECDGSIYHHQENQLEKDAERDGLMAQRGWTVLRFDDKVIHEQPVPVQQTIVDYIQKITDKHNQKGEKSAEVEHKETSAHCFTIKQGALEDLYGRHAEYFEIVNFNNQEPIE